MNTKYKLEADFEEALIALLQNKGWEREVIKNPTQEDLLRNWADILFENNRSIDRLGDAPLTDTEMQQIVEQIADLRTPLRLNGFINGKTVSIKRDNPADPLHVGKEVSLKIYDRREIAAGQSRYQIAQQPQLHTPNPIHPNRRGDLMLLINGMPVIHIELKRSGIPVSQAYNQIEKYRHEGVFSGIYSLIQIFVAMEPEEAVYFANPGPDGVFNKDYCFHWADFNNEPVRQWRAFAASLLNIPMAHQLIGFYTVADESDGILKVMRSYQYYAANAISDKVAKTDWSMKNNRGGYVWHTTGSGKTMTSFKSAQLIANSKDADKVIFLMDRIELGTQSLQEYRNFAEDHEEVQATEDTQVLISKLKSDSPADTLIVTSIQKMKNVTDGEEGGLKGHDLKKITDKRIVMIIDECHRSTFGDMLLSIKHTFPQAVMFGFTGTPIHDENSIGKNTTTTVFGNELHRYSIADGIRDGNVLGFDTYKVLTYKDIDLRRAVALQKAQAATEQDAMDNPAKKDIYYKYMDSSQVPMRRMVAEGERGIEDEIGRGQYDRDEHRHAVVEDIMENWNRLSHNSKFHALFATSSIAEAIAYYRLFKKVNKDFKVTALFDPNIDNKGNTVYKEDGLVEIIEDYNERYGQRYTMSTHAGFKKDLAARLAHKEPHRYIGREPGKQLQLLIVVDQMLTGFDSKYLNTLYLDKVLEYQNIIQAFSRTNRLFGPEKPFGTIRYYRFPHTMEENIRKAVKLYSGDKPLGLFADELPHNLSMMNKIYEEIELLFERAGVSDFERLPDDKAVCGEFARQLGRFNGFLQAARIQGFTWDQERYAFKSETDTGDVKGETVVMMLDQQKYLTLVQRYKELSDGDGGQTNGEGDLPYDIDAYLTTIDTDTINTDYINSRFEKYLKSLDNKALTQEEKRDILNELHSSFASLSQDDQKYANLFLHDVQNGDANLTPGKTLREYITEYQMHTKSEQVRRAVELLGVDGAMLSNMVALGLSDANLNEFGRFDQLCATADIEKAQAYFEAAEGQPVKGFRVVARLKGLLKKFITDGGMEL